MIKCTRCSCFKNEYGINCIPFSGNDKADVYFLGEMAGKNEAEASRLVPSHFISKAGAILNYLLELAQLRREDIAIANSHRCYKANNGKPTKPELDACFIHTYNEIQKIKPKLVVLLGDCALKLALDVDGISAYRGKLLWSDKLQCNVLPTYHPMAVGYDPSKRQDIENDFKLIPSLLNKEQNIKKYNYVYIDNPDDFKLEFIRDELRLANYICLDVEATGLDAFKDELKIVQMNIGKEPIYIFHEAVVGEHRDFFKDLIETKRIIGQTFEFDTKYLYTKFGIFPEQFYFDTCLAEYMLTGLKDNDLTYLVSKYAPESFGYDVYVSSLGGAHKVKDFSKLLEYGACDVGVLPIIMKKQMKQLVNRKMDWFFFNILMPCNKVLTKMSLRGVEYDIDELWKVDAQYQQRGEKLLNKALMVPGIEETEEFFKQRFNPKSSHHIKYLLLNYYGLPILKKTKKGGASVGKEEMAKYAEAPHKNKYCSIMEKYRGIEAIRTNFLSGVIDKLDGNVAHTVYSLHATTTSRPNSRNPNLLNLPSRSDDKDIKGCIVARDGYQFVYSDMSQIEVRVAAVVFDDKNLIDLCNKVGQDFHSTIASGIYNIPYGEFYAKYKAGDSHINDLRTAAKKTTFGILYQMSAVALAYQLGISEAKAQKFIDDYFKGFPDLAFNIEKLKKFVTENHYVRNYFGFERHWHLKEDDDVNAMLREAVNFPIQSTAFNLVELSLIKIDNEFGKLRDSIRKNGLVLQVYDAIIAEVKNEDVDSVARLMKDVMTTVNEPFKGLNRVKLLADFQVGKTLKSLEKHVFKNN